MEYIASLQSVDLINSLNAMSHGVDEDTSELWVHSTGVPAAVSAPALCPVGVTGKAPSGDLMEMKRNGRWNELLISTRDLLSTKLSLKEDVRQDRVAMSIWHLRLCAMVNTGYIADARKEAVGLGHLESVSFARADGHNCVPFEMRLAVAEYMLYDDTSGLPDPLTYLYMILIRCNCLIACNAVCRSRKAVDLWQQRRTQTCSLICQNLVKSGQISSAVALARLLKNENVWLQMCFAMLRDGMRPDQTLAGLADGDWMITSTVQKCEPYLAAFDGDYKKASRAFTALNDTSNSAVCDAYNGQLESAIEKLNEQSRIHMNRAVACNKDIFCRKLIQFTRPNT